MPARALPEASLADPQGGVIRGAHWKGCLMRGFGSPRTQAAKGRRLGRHAGNLHVWFQDLTLNPNFFVWWENSHPVHKSETKLPVPERSDCEAANRFLIKARRCAAQQK
jgi:hypothetical protein